VSQIRRIVIFSFAYKVCVTSEELLFLVFAYKVCVTHPKSVNFATHTKRVNFDEKRASHAGRVVI